jgi:hypothetical protein
MSVLLFVVGAIAVMVGVGMVGYGIPINEFSFGNTLIVAGTTAVVGGLIVIAISAAVSKLQRIAETLATRTPVRSNRPIEMFEPPSGSRAAPMPGQIPVPPRPKSEAAVHEAQPPADMAVEDHPAAAAAPTLRNPDRPVAAVEEYEVKEYAEVSLSPQQPLAAPAPVERDEPAPPPPVSDDAFPVAGMRPEPAFDALWRSSPPPPPQPPPERQSQASYFDALWPAESKPAKRPVNDEPKPEPKPKPKPKPKLTPAPAAQAQGEPVAILKSGVVDGMGYTLYVDGSIEAELPDGTLHFASINELREHLAKNP